MVLLQGKGAEGAGWTLWILLELLAPLESEGPGWAAAGWAGASWVGAAIAAASAAVRKVYKKQILFCC